MKYLKTLGLLAIAAAALTAFAGTASATLTSPTGTAYTGEISATSTNMHTSGTVKMACKHSLIVSSHTGGATTGAVSTLSFSECVPDTVTIISNGSLNIAAGVGGVVSEGMEVTKLTHKTVLGFPITAHCIYATAPTGTSIGTITDSHKTGGHAIIHVHANLMRTATDSACGEDPATWTGTYTVNKPSTLYAD